MSSQAIRFEYLRSIIVLLHIVTSISFHTITLVYFWAVDFASFHVLFLLRLFLFMLLFLLCLFIFMLLLIFCLVPFVLLLLPFTLLLLLCHCFLLLELVIPSFSHFACWGWSLKKIDNFFLWGKFFFFVFFCCLFLLLLF